MALFAFSIIIIFIFARAVGSLSGIMGTTGTICRSLLAIFTFIITFMTLDLIFIEVAFFAITGIL